MPKCNVPCPITEGVISPSLHMASSAHYICFVRCGYLIVFKQVSCGKCSVRTLCKSGFLWEPFPWTLHVVAVAGARWTMPSLFVLYRDFPLSPCDTILWLQSPSMHCLVVNIVCVIQQVIPFIFSRKITPFMQCFVCFHKLCRSYHAIVWTEGSLLNVRDDSLGDKSKEHHSPDGIATKLFWKFCHSILI